MSDVQYLNINGTTYDIAAKHDSAGNVIVDTYATKAQANKVYVCVTRTINGIISLGSNSINSNIVVARGATSYMDYVEYNSSSTLTLDNRPTAGSSSTINLPCTSLNKGDILIMNEANYYNMLITDITSNRIYRQLLDDVVPATTNTMGSLIKPTISNIDGTGYTTNGYYYDKNTQLQICFGTTSNTSGLITVEFARNFKGAPTVVLEPFFKSTSVTSIGTQYRNAQTVRCYLVNKSANTSYSKSSIVTGFWFDSGNNENQYFNYIAIGHSENVV